MSLSQPMELSSILGQRNENISTATTEDERDKTGYSSPQLVCKDLPGLVDDSNSRKLHNVPLLNLRTMKPAPLPAASTDAASLSPRDKKNDQDITASVSPVSSATQFSSSVQKLAIRQSLHQIWLHWFTAYRVLIAVSFLLNIVIAVVVVQKHQPINSLLIATSVNFLAAVLVRQEDLINASFLLVAKTPTRLPLCVRKTIADFHHYGGVHIGCALSALLWYCLFVTFNTRLCVQRARAQHTSIWLWADMATSYMFLLCILLVCVLAHPRLRSRFHNTFERTHRFGGWSALLVLWLHTGLATRSSSPPAALYTSPSLYLLGLTTLLIILPWLRIRRVPLHATRLTPRTLQLTLPYPHMPYTSTIRLSTAPLTEWHAFATIPCSTTSSALVLVSQAGDWTTRLIAHPPHHIWLRRPPTRNFLACAPLFSSLLLVATGAGIGPVVSLLRAPCVAAMRRRGRTLRVLWCMDAVWSAAWAFVRADIHAVDAQAVLLDSARERPDMVFEAREMVLREGLEGVMVVSNARVTRGVVEAVKSVGGAAYGAVFDS